VGGWSSGARVSGQLVGLLVPGVGDWLVCLMVMLVRQMNRQRRTRGPTHALKLSLAACVHRLKVVGAMRASTTKCGRPLAPRRSLHQVYSHFDEPELLDDLKDHWVCGRRWMGGGGGRSSRNHCCHKLVFATCSRRLLLLRHAATLVEATHCQSTALLAGPKSPDAGACVSHCLRTAFTRHARRSRRAPCTGEPQPQGGAPLPD
jgi:hypothetical protein